MKKGILLINLGTPDSPSVPDVKRYLRQFLSDPRVIDINPIARYFLVNFVIVPGRSVSSAKLYEQVWTERGSPLLFHSTDLKNKVKARTGDSIPVTLGMRYGEPSIRNALNDLIKAGVTDLVVLPLYPQYASSSTQTAIDETNKVLKALAPGIRVKFITHFFNDPDYINCFVANARKFDLGSYDHFLFSYHGLPERHIYKSADELGIKTCRIGSCCDKLHKGNELCYRASCFETTRLISGALNLPAEKITNAFQSRLNDKWLKPYSDKVLIELVKEGKKRILVFSPAFVADCLETIYEIGIEYDHLFRANGGEKIDLVPSLNSNEDWVNAVMRLVATQT